MIEIQFFLVSASGMYCILTHLSLILRAMMIMLGLLNIS